MQFPIKESNVHALAGDVTAGFVVNTAVYPSPPVSTADLQAAIDAFTAAKSQTIANKAHYEESVSAKNEALATLKVFLKTDLRYAENTVKFDDDKLKLLGWSGRRARHSQKIPGQPRSLDAPKQGEGWLYLDWKKPTDGGKTAAYKIQRRPGSIGGNKASSGGTASGGGKIASSGGDISSGWNDIATAMETEITLENQPRGVELEYRIIAINKAGSSPPSNTEMAVL